jgi:hypothetical protein
MRLPQRILAASIFLLAGCGPAAVGNPPTPTDTIPPKVVPTDTPAPTLTATKAATRTPTIELTVLSVIDDFEGPKTDWIAGIMPEYMDSSSTAAVLSMDYPSEGSQSLEIDFEANDKQKAIFYVDRPFDFSRTGAIRFDIFNPATAAGVGIAFLAGPDRVWQESDSLPLRAGKTNTLTFDLTASDYKTAATGWEFTASLADLDQVTRLAIIVYPLKSGAVYLDNIVLMGIP